MHPGLVILDVPAAPVDNDPFDRAGKMEGPLLRQDKRMEKQTRPSALVSHAIGVVNPPCFVPFVGRLQRIGSPTWFGDPMCLLPRHDDFQGIFIVLDQFSAHVHSRAMERAGELERRLVLIPDRGASVGTAHDSSAETKA